MFIRFGLFVLLFACIPEPKEEDSDIALPDTSEPSDETGDTEDRNDTEDSNDTENTENIEDLLTDLEEAFNVAFTEAPSAVDGMTLVVHDATDARIIEFSAGNVSPQTRMPIV